MAGPPSTYRRLLWLCLLWPLEIGPEVIPPPLKPEIGQSPKIQRVPRPTKSVPPLSPARPLTGSMEATIDDAAFRAALARQAGARLTPCLISWRPSPAQVLVKAQLDRRGRLSSVLSLDPAWPLPQCAVLALQEMTFADAALPLKVDATTVQWRLDW